MLGRRRAVELLLRYGAKPKLLNAYVSLLRWCALVELSHASNARRAGWSALDEAISYGDRFARTLRLLFFRVCLDP